MTLSLPIIYQDITEKTGFETKMDMVDGSCIGKHGLGFAFPKDYTFGKMISDTLFGLQDAVDGDSYLKKKWFLDYCHDYTPVEQFHLTYFSGLFVVVGFTVAIGLCVNIVEYFYITRKSTGNRKDEKRSVNESDVEINSLNSTLAQ